MRYYCDNCHTDIEIETSPDGIVSCPNCGSILGEMEFAPGTMISGFQIVKEIGRGGNGVVYLAHQINLERNIALKILPYDKAHDEEFVERFFKEARAAASLSHPHIVQAYDAGVTDKNIYYFAMELIDGETVDDMIEHAGAIELHKALDFAIEIAEALEYAWDRKRLTHGDIKPDNIIINSRGEAKLADLGLAKAAHEETAEIMATPMYAPPEVIRGEVENIGIRSDIYSFGATLYHMFSGHPPFDEEDPEKVMDMHLNDNHVPLANDHSFFDPEISLFIDSMLAKDPNDRPEDWTRIVTFLRQARANLKSRTSTVIPIDPQVKKIGGLKYKITLPVALGILVVLIIMIIIGAYLVMELLKRNKQADAGGQLAVVAGIDKLAPETEIQEMTNKWNSLKREISDKSTSDKVGKIKSFMQNNNLPEPLRGEVLKVLLTFETEFEKEQKAIIDKQQSRAAYVQELADFQQELAQTKMENRNIAHLVELKNSAVELLNRGLNNVALKDVLSDTARQKLQQAISTLDAYITSRAAAVSQRTAEYLSSKLDGLRRDRKIQQSRNNIISATYKNGLLLAEYFLILNKLTTAPDNREDDILKKLHKLAAATGLPEDKRKNLGMLENLLECPDDVIPVFVANQELMRNRVLPWGKGERADYVIGKLTVSQIFMIKPLGDGGFMGYKINWDEVNDSQKLALMRDRLLTHGSFFKHKDIYALCGWLLRRKYYDTLEEYILKYNPSLKADQKKVLSSLLKDMDTASVEDLAWALWSKIETAAENDKPDTLISLIPEMISKYSATQCFQYTAAAMKYLQYEASMFSTDGHFYSLYKKYLRAVDYNKQKDRLNLSAALATRYFMADNREIRTQVREIYFNIKGMIDRSVLYRQEIPFYAWEYENPGDGFKFYLKVLKESPSRTDNQPIMRLLYNAAEIDTGLWRAAKMLFSTTHKDLVSADFVLRDKNKRMMPALLFGYAVAAQHFSSGSDAEKVMALMLEIIKSTEDKNIKAGNYALAMEMAFVVGRPDFASTIVSDYEFTPRGSSLKAEMRIAVLHLLAIIEQNNPFPAKEFAAFFGKYSEKFSSVKFRNDLLISSIALRMLRGEAVEATELSVLEDCVAPDACARLICAAYSRNYFNSGDSLNYQSMAEKLLPQVAPAFGSGDLWRRLLLLELSRPDRSLSDLSRTVSKFLDDSRICAIRHYSELLILDASLKMASRDYPLKRIIRYLDDSFEASVLTSRDENFCLQAMRDFRVDRFEKFIHENSDSGERTRFMVICLGISRMINDDPAKATEFIARNREAIYSGKLGWEEKMFIANLEQWALAWNRLNIK